LHEHNIGKIPGTTIFDSKETMRGLCP